MLNVLVMPFALELPLSKSLFPRLLQQFVVAVQASLLPIYSEFLVKMKNFLLPQSAQVIVIVILGQRCQNCACGYWKLSVARTAHVA